MLVFSLSSSLAIILLFVVAIAGIRSSAFDEDLANKARNEARRIAGSLSVPLWSYDTESCDQILKSDLEDRDFVALVLREDSGSIVSAFGRVAGKGPSPVALDDGFVGSDNLAVAAKAKASAPVAYRGRAIGEVDVFASGEASLREFRSTLEQQVLVSLLEGTIIALLAFFAADRLVSRRVLRLGEDIGRFSEKNLAARSSDLGSDEIGTLARNFNEMAETIQRHAEGLEKIVAGRTHELADANRELHDANAKLSATVEELRDAQDEIVESRRIAALGQIVGGIAHQLNTPLAAIVSANRFLSEQLSGRILRIADDLADLDEVDAAILTEMLAESQASEDSSDFALLRAKKRELRALFSEQGLPDPEGLAETVVDANLHGLGSRLLEFLGTRRIGRILSIVEAVNEVRRAGIVISTASERASSVIRALRVYLGQDRGGERFSVALAASIGEVLALFARTTRGAVDVITHLDRSVRVSGRPEQLDLVWINLIDNAMQAMAGKGRLEVTVARSGGSAMVSILDTGRGVPPEIGDHIFDAFTATGPRLGGIGIGLPTAKTIVEDHGGTISFESETGRTVFTVTLPVLDEPMEGA